MKSILKIFVLIGSLLFCSPKADSEKQVASLIQQNALIVDVRTLSEFDSGHFPNAKHIPVDEVANRLSEFGDKTKPIILYCRSGNRSGKAKQILESAGFTNITNAGGLSDMPKR